MEKPPLLDDTSDSDVELKVNQDYAQAYDRWRQKEEFQKLKGKYGNVSSASSSSSDSEDDERPLVDKSFFKALSLVKSHDSKIYEVNRALLPDSEVEAKKPKKKKPKPLFLKDYERKVVLETGGNFSESEEELPQKKITFNEEQEHIRKSFIDFDVSEDDDDSSDILKVRSVTKAEQEKLEEDYITYLKGEKAIAKEDQDEKKELTFLHDFWNDPKLSEKERFLRDYFLNAGYEEDDKSGEIPTYEDITNGDMAESEEEVAAEFEQKYNFRFEEPDSEFIKRYPRTMKDSLRQKDQKRKIKREEYAERKRLEKEQRREEIKRLKVLKRKEIEEKMNLLRETLDDENITLQDVDMEGDFDPAEHDRKMSELFSDQYYDVPEEAKPSFPEDEDLDLEDWDNWTGNDDAEHSHSTNYDGPHCEDPDFDMDADCNDPKLAFQKEMIGASKQRGKKKKKSQFASIVGKKKPVFDPSDKSFEQYFDEYYRLDCEDFIGDLQTRFRYREVVPNDFGLSVDEILSADDKELNHWCSLKKVCQHRAMEEELYDVQAYKKKAQNQHKKIKVFSTLYNEAEDVCSTEQKTKKKKQNKTKSLNENIVVPESDKTESSNSALQSDAADQPCTSTDHGMKKWKKNRNVAPKEDTVVPPVNENTHDLEVSSSTMQNDGVSPSSFKTSKRKYVEEDLNVTEESKNLLNAGFQDQKKKKRKHSKKKIIKSQSHDPGDGETSNYVKSPHQQKQNKHKAVEADKRLLLSNKRLEAYGINPKKFKNKIRFSNK